MMPQPKSSEKAFSNPATPRSVDTPTQAPVDDTASRIEDARARPTAFKEYEKGKGTGLVIAIISLGKGKKTVFSWLPCYMNLDFKGSMGPKTYETLHTGQLPEVEQVCAVDTEESIKRDMDHGYLGEITKDFRKNHKIHIESAPLIRTREKSKDGEIIKVDRDFDAEKMRENFEAAVWQAAERYKGNTLLILDSFSDYRDMITDEQDDMAGKTVVKKYGKKKGVEDDEETGTDRRFYRYRNKWWTNVLMKLRTTECWVVETFKLEVREPEWQWKDIKVRVGADPKNPNSYVMHSIKLPETYPVMISKTDYRIDQGYTLRQVYDMKTGTFVDKIRTDWYRHPHSTMPYLKIPQEQRDSLEEKCFLDYPQYDRMAFTYLIEDMAPSILQNSGKTTWGKYEGAQYADDEKQEAVIENVKESKPAATQRRRK